MMDRNPSPPPELKDNEEIFYGDNIGHTAFSKHWLFTTLSKVIEEVEKHEKCDDESDLGIDVDEELQNDLCKLWDMSTDQEVSIFLDEFKAISVLIGVISKSKAPRVTEICVGILGNMACNKEICVKMTDNVELMNLVLLLLENTDPPTLVETTRMLYTCLSNDIARQPWIDLIELSQFIPERIRFIFTSSTNTDLLKNVGEFLDQLLDQEDNISSKWTSAEFVEAMLEAYSQIGKSSSESQEIYLHILQLFSTTEKGVAALLVHSDMLTDIIMAYLTKVCDDEIVGVEDHSRGLLSTISVLNVLFASSDDVSDTLLKDEQLLRILLKVMEPVYKENILNRETKKENGTTDEEPIMKDNTNTNDKNTNTSSKNTHECNYVVGGTHATKDLTGESSLLIIDSLTDIFQNAFEQIRMLTNSIGELLFEMFSVVYRKSQSSPESPHDIYMPLLHYLDSTCSRNRITILINSLQKSATKDFNPVDMILDVSHELKQKRLVRIINEILSGKTISRTDSNCSNVSQASTT